MSKYNNNEMFDITINRQSKKEVLEQIKKYISSPKGFCHIVSLNPENIVVTQENSEFKRIVKTAQIKIIDGIGVVLAAQMLHIKAGDRITGVELMEELVRIAQMMRLRVLLIGGKRNLAKHLSECYNMNFPEASFKGIEGIADITNPKKNEENSIFSIVSQFKPHIVLVAFGSPAQELWLDRHKDKFSKIVCMGVGGSFDYLSGEITRPAKVIRSLGLEWLYRLITQPWRWKRQLRLIKFIKLVIQEKWKKR